MAIIDDMLTEHGCDTPRACINAARCRTARCDIATLTPALDAAKRRIITELTAEFAANNPPTNRAVAEKFGCSRRQASKIRQLLGLPAHRDIRDGRVVQELTERVARILIGTD